MNHSKGEIYLGMYYKGYTQIMSHIFWNRMLFHQTSKILYCNKEGKKTMKQSSS
jgi:hypothetical protein